MILSPPSLTQELIFANQSIPNSLYPVNRWQTDSMFFLQPIHQWEGRSLLNILQKNHTIHLFFRPFRDENPPPPPRNMCQNFLLHAFFLFPFTLPPSSTDFGFLLFILTVSSLHRIVSFPFFTVFLPFLIFSSSMGTGRCTCPRREEGCFLI